MSISVKRRRHDEDQLPARDKILNAAERLFSQRGYYGVTLREIAKEAGVDLALINYYFGPKQALFHQVVGRRADEHAAAIRAALEAAVKAAGDRTPTVESVLRAFAQPVVDRLMRGGEGWRNYIHLLSYLTNSQQQQTFMAPMHQYYDPVERRCLALLEQALPAASRQSICRSFYLTIGALSHIYSETGGIDRLSDGACTAADLDTLLDHLVPFLAAGFYRLATA